MATPQQGSAARQADHIRPLSSLSGMLLLLLLLPIVALAQTPAPPPPLTRADLPPNITAGMDALRSDGADDAIKFWLKSSALEGNKETLEQAETLRSVQRTFGRFQYFDLIRMQDTSSRVRVAYMVLNYERGPLFARFVIYRAPTGWVLSSFRFSTDDTTILPVSLQ